MKSYYRFGEVWSETTVAVPAERPLARVSGPGPKRKQFLVEDAHLYSGLGPLNESEHPCWYSATTGDR